MIAAASPAQTGLSATLQRIAKQGPEGSYAGETAQSIFVDAESGLRLGGADTRQTSSLAVGH